MVSGFSKRKIKTEQTLGELLKSERDKRELSIEDAELGTKVKAKFLLAIESNNWQVLPSLAYVRGFVLAYAKFLEIDRSQAIKLFENEARYNKSNQNHTLSYRNTIKDVKLLITPKLVGYLFLSFCVISMFGYIIYQVQGFAGSPNLKVLSPSNNQIVESDGAEILGITDTDSILEINEEVVPVTYDGHFYGNIKLHRGVNVVQVKATNKAKKETSQTLTIEYKPKTALIDSLVNQ